MTKEITRFSVKDAYVFEITTLSATPVYAAGIQVDCVRKIGYQRDIVTAELTGSGRVCHATRQVKKLGFELDFGGVKLDLNALLQGSTLVEIVGPPVESHLFVGIEDREVAFGLVAEIWGLDGGGAHVALFHCREQGGGPSDLEEDSYGTTTYSGVGLAAPENNKTLYAEYHLDAQTDIDPTWATNVVTDLTAA